MPDARAPEEPGLAKIIRPGHRFGPRENNPIHRTAVSGIEAFSICAQYHGLAYDGGLKAADEKPARAIGTLVHVGLAYRYGALLPTKPEWMVYPTPQAPDPRHAIWTIGHDNPEARDEALRVFDAYQEFHTTNTLQPVLVEHQFETILPIPGGPPERYTLRIDLLAYDMLTGQLCLIDHKSAYKLTKNTGYGYRADREMLTALMLCRANGHDVQRVVINAMTKERPTPRFGRFDVPISAEAYNRIPRETVYWIQQMRAVKAAFPDPTDRPRTLASCVRKFGVCDFWPVCSDGPQRLAEFTNKW